MLQSLYGISVTVCGLITCFMLNFTLLDCIMMKECYHACF